MKKMENLPPSPYQLEQVKKIRELIGGEINVDDFDETLQNDDVFLLWDNIATDEYERQGGEFKKNDPNEPVDIRLFEDCQRHATDLVCELTT